MFPGVSVTDVSTDSANKVKSVVCSQGDLLYVFRPLEVGGSLLVDQYIICARLLLIPHFLIYPTIFKIIQLLQSFSNFSFI